MRLLLVLLAVLASPAAAANDEVAGGAGDLPGPVPAGVRFAETPPAALSGAATSPPSCSTGRP